jgi:hypothetical protein
MLIHDDIFQWEGWGGILKLASGRCRLRIYDLSRDKASRATLLKPMMVIVSDIGDNHSAFKSVSIRSCAGHIATSVVRQFQIDPNRMVFIEYYPRQTYGEQHEHLIDEKYDVVDFQWHDGKALHPKWRPLQPPLLDTVRAMIDAG